MIVALLALAGVVAGVVGGYVTARLKNSGKINTTEASTLWTQLNQMFQDVTLRANELELKLGRQKDAHDEAMSRMFKQLEAAENRWTATSERLNAANEEIRKLRLRLNGGPK